jgi:hypothetical protein
MTYECYTRGRGESGSGTSNIVVRGADAEWIEDRASEAAAARSSWRSWGWSAFDLRARDFRGAYLAGVDLGPVDLSGARLDRSVLFRANLNGAVLDGVSARGADFRGAGLVGVGVDRADFTHADFAEADLDEHLRATLLDFEPPRTGGLQGPFDVSLVTECGYEFRDVVGRTVGLIAARTWQSAAFELARSRGLAGLAPCDEGYTFGMAGVRRPSLKLERRCAMLRPEVRALLRKHTLWQDE